MSTPTLETLKADFEVALRKTYKVGPGTAKITDHATTADDVLKLLVLFTPLSDSPGFRQLIDQANVYVVARDHGLETAMLYKLSGGNIDPRKGGAA